MADRHVSDRLAAFADGELDAAEAARIETHLAACASCQEAWERYQFAAGALRQLTLVEAPPSIRSALDAALDARGRSAAEGTASPWWRRPSIVWPAAAALVAIVLIAGGRFRLRGPAPPAVATTQPADRVDVVRLDRDGARVSVGDWIETDGGSTARIGIGDIGTVDVGSNTRVRLLAAARGEHRLGLAEGAISVRIVAPPRIFFVETPASTVVDLGCAYTMQVDRHGTGTLRVTDGWASLEWTGRESLVPAGASCPVRPSVGPGTPTFDDASDRMRHALVAFDFGPEPAASLGVILSEARVRDTLTLWHLMARVAPEDRARVFDRIVALAPLPPDLDREKALALDADTMRRWREELAWTW
jgi:hypothetical protein